MSVAESQQENLTEKNTAVRQPPYKYKNFMHFFLNMLFGARPDSVHGLNENERTKEKSKHVYP